MDIMLKGIMGPEGWLHHLRLGSPNDLNQMKSQKQRFQTLIENAPFGKAVIVSGCDFKYINPKSRAIMGYDLKDIGTESSWFSRAKSEFLAKEAGALGQDMLLDP